MSQWMSFTFGQNFLSKKVKTFSLKMLFKINIEQKQSNCVALLDNIKYLIIELS